MRWTMTLAGVFAALELAWAVPIVWLALTGRLINPAFAEQIGYPGLVDGNGVVMLSIAVATTLVTAWEIVSAFLRARRPATGVDVPDVQPFGVSRQRVDFFAR